MKKNIATVMAPSTTFCTHRRSFTELAKPVEMPRLCCRVTAAITAASPPLTRLDAMCIQHKDERGGYSTRMGVWLQQQQQQQGRSLMRMLLT